MTTDTHTLVVGERINPTGKPRLTASLDAGELDRVLRLAAAQAAQGVDALDVNVGVPGLDEAALLPRAALAVREATGLTVCVDSSSPAALGAALAVLPSGTMINSVTGAPESLDALLPLAAEHQAVVIGIAKDQTCVPETVAERLEIAERIVRAAEGHGVPRARLLIDFLAMPISTAADAAQVTLECVARGTRELGVGTILGASNVSFGMPTRPVLNAAYLAMAIRAGLTAAIVNPGEPGLMQAILAADMLTARDPLGRRLLQDYRLRRRPAPKR